MAGQKTNERPGTRAVLRGVRMSATKARVVLDQVRGLPVAEAADVLYYTERAAADVIGKALASAVANAENNDEIDPESLYVSACFADEGRTLYRHRPRARGRATKIRKRTCHITVIVSPMPAEMAQRVLAKRAALPGSRAARRAGQQAAEERKRRVAASQASATDEVEELIDELDADETDETVESIEDAEVDTEDVEVGEPTEQMVAEALEAAAEDDAAAETETEEK